MAESLMEILSNVTGFITYFAPGYVFISCFDLASCRQRESRIEYLIIKSISLSYIMFVLVSYIASKINMSNNLAQLITIVFSLLVGFLFGKIFRTKFINNIFQLLFKRDISQNFFVDLWDEAVKNQCIVCVALTMKDNQGVYEGQISRVISYHDRPKLIISYYCYYDYERNLISDFSDMEDSFILVDYSDVQKFEYEIAKPC